jgi:hypothetical protein
MHRQEELQCLKRCGVNKPKAMGNIQNTIEPTAVILFYSFLYLIKTGFDIVRLTSYC